MKLDEPSQRAVRCVWLLQTRAHTLREKHTHAQTNTQTTNMYTHADKHTDIIHVHRRRHIRRLIGGILIHSLEVPSSTSNAE
jgi:hypothetical protein